MNKSQCDRLNLTLSLETPDLRLKKDEHISTPTHTQEFNFNLTIVEIEDVCFYINPKKVGQVTSTENSCKPVKFKQRE